MIHRAMVWVLLVWAGCWGIEASPSRGDDSEQLTRLLQAGEFSRAQQFVASLPSQDQDAARARLAIAQLVGGAPLGAARTYGSLSDDGLPPARLPAGGSTGGLGGGVIADFTTLMDLIRETIDPDSWDDTDGNGKMAPFPAGVLVDAAGTLRLAHANKPLLPLNRLREASSADRGNRDVRVPSALRKVSLTRLERQLKWRTAAGLPPTDAMRHVAGLYAITHLFVYPESGDVVIAGPADGWERDSTGHHVSMGARKPTLWLDDWIEVWRNTRHGGGSFYCSIEPRAENLSRTVEFLAKAREDGITGNRDAFLSELQQVLGKQDLVVEGISPRSRAAHVILQADYHMKRVGLGLEPSVLGAPSYLDLLGASSNGAPANRVLRWWFTLRETPVVTAANELAFELPREVVRLQSENPRVDATGQREATGRRDPFNHRFATLFTQHFDDLAKRYPVYEDLRNVMHWAMVAALVDERCEQAGLAWRGEFFSDPTHYRCRLGDQPKVVDSVVNYRRFRSGRVVYAVSGGVEVRAGTWLARQESRVPDRYGTLPALHAEQARPPQLPPERWWWD